MNFESSEHLQDAELKALQISAIATVAGEAAEQIEQPTLALCLQVIERLGRECQKHIKQAEIVMTE